MEETGVFRIIDNWRNLNTSISESGKIIIYFGKNAPEQWEFNLPAKTNFSDGTALKVTLIDTWNMTKEDIDHQFSM
jgi:hypothetical protein